MSLQMQIYRVLSLCSLLLNPFQNVNLFTKQTNHFLMLSMKRGMAQPKKACQDGFRILGTQKCMLGIQRSQIAGHQPVLSGDG